MRIRLHRHPIGQAVLGWLIAHYIKLVTATSRFELRCDPGATDLIGTGRPLIGAFWHGRMAMIAPAWHAAVREVGLERPLQPYVISSDHADGRLMGRATDRLGIKTVYAATKRAGGLALLRAALGVLRRGNIAVVTPDGPRGPRMRAKSGTTHLAIRAGVPILPVSFASRHQHVFKSWDRFALPRPFDRGVFAFGAPLYLSQDEDPDAASLRLEQVLNALTAEADRAVGREPVQPA